MKHSAIAGMWLLAATACHGAPTAQGVDAATVAPATPERIELTEGQVVDAGHGATLRLKSVFEAHLSDSRNETRVTLEVSRSGKTEVATLQRLYPGPPNFTAVLGLQLAIDFGDAYHQPSTAAVLLAAP